MSRTIATSQSREPPSTDAVPDRPPPTSGDPSRISADGVTSPSPRLGFATAGRDTLGSALAGEGPSCSVGERRWNDRESRPAGALRPDHQAGQPTGALGRDRAGPCVHVRRRSNVHVKWLTERLGTGTNAIMTAWQCGD